MRRNRLDEKAEHKAQQNLSGGASSVRYAQRAFSAPRRVSRVMAVFGVLVGGLLMAAPEARAEDVVYEKHTVVDFGDDTIDGNLSRPDGQYLEARKRQKQIKLIKVRENFRAEILQSVRVL